MGCSGSKATKTAEPGKTLLAAESAAAEADSKNSANKGPDYFGAAVQLKITISNARSLRNADCAIAGKSDPYCTCEVSGKPESKIQTDIVSDKLNPEWNYESDLVGYCVGNSLTFVVMDKDPLKPDDILGKATLATSQFFPAGFDGEVPLAEAGEGVEAFLKVQVSVVHPQLKVNVVGAKNLRNADWVGKSDPYCRCEITGRPECGFETPSVTDNLNPEWKHQSLLDGYRAEDGLTFVVKDKDPAKPDDILGKVTVPFASFAEGTYEGELQLTETQNDLACFLNVKIEMGASVDTEEKAEVALEVALADAAAPVTAPVDILVEEQPSQGKACFC